MHSTTTKAVVYGLAWAVGLMAAPGAVRAQATPAEGAGIAAPAAPAKAQPAPSPKPASAKPKVVAQQQRQRQTNVPPGSVPPSAPFTGPAENRPMPPPAPAPEGAVTGEPMEPGASIEERFREFQAKQIVTTAGKREQKLQDVPLTLSVIPAEELEGTAQFTLCDTAQYFPGMECRRGAMRKAVVSARGLGSNFLANRLLLLKDGRPETDPFTGQFYPDETTPLTNMKQLEVIRGPGSALYGTNAFSGVINMIERGPDDLMQEGRSYGVDFRTLYGQYNTFRLQSTAAGKAGPIKALVNYYGYTTDGPSLLNNPAAKVVDTNEFAQVQQVTGKLEIKSLGIDAGYTTSDEGRPGGVVITTVGNCGRCHYRPNDHEEVENFYTNAHIDQKVSDFFRFYADGYVNFKRRKITLENQITNDLQPTLGKRRRVGGEARGLFNISSLTLTLGGDAKSDTVNNQNILTFLQPDDVREQILGAFVDAEYRPFPSVIIGAGARYDYYDMPEIVWRNRTAQVSPRGSLVYHIMPELTLRADYGHAFRAPTLAELTINQQMYAATLQGNPYLKAETLDTVEVAADVWPLGEILRLSVTGFYNVASDFINQERVGGSTSQFQNIGDARVVGLEFEAAAQVPRWKSAFDVAYQYLNSRATPPGQPAGPLDYAPTSRAYIRAHKRFGYGVFADFYGLLVGQRQDPGYNVDTMGNPTTHVNLPLYFVANARVGAEVYRNLMVSLLATNLFDAQYETMLGFPEAGLSIFSEAKFIY